MASFFEWLAQQSLHPAVPDRRSRRLVGRPSSAATGSAWSPAAIIVGCGLSVWGSAYGVKLELNNFTKIDVLLPLHVRGRAAGRAVVRQQPGGDGLKFTFLALCRCVIGLRSGCPRREAVRAAPGAAGGMLAGSQTMSAAIGSAEEAVKPGVVKLPAGTTPDQVSAMIALSYGITYIWGTVGIILITKYLPRWWGVDAKAAAEQYEEEYGVASGDIPADRLDRRFGLRAYRLENPDGKARPSASFRKANPEYRSRQCRARRQAAGRRPTTRCCKGRRHRAGRPARAHDREDGPDRPRGRRSPRRSTFRSIRQKSWSPTRTWWDGPCESCAPCPIADQIQLGKIERGGVPIPIGLKTKLQRMDIISVVGLKDAVNELRRYVGPGRAAEHRDRPADAFRSA